MALTSATNLFTLIYATRRWFGFVIDIFVVQSKKIYKYVAVFRARFVTYILYVSDRK